MTFLFGTDHSARSLSERAGSLSQFGGVRLVRLEDGPGRGVRLLMFDAGNGLRFSVAVDRALDIVEMSHNGRAIGWHSAAGIRHPAFTAQDEEGGLGWNRSFTGFLATGGLDHILGPEEVPADNFGYARKTTVRHGLHGRIANTPARLSGYGETWQGDRCILWAEGTATQATLFGECLTLTRRIEVDLGGLSLRLSDQVVNTGFSPMPHMLLYHVNLGHPLIDKGTRYIAPIRSVIHAPPPGSAEGPGYRACPAPIPGFAEQVWQHDMATDRAGQVSVAVVNDRLALGLVMDSQAAQLPCHFQWQNFRSGNYVLAIEAATHHVPGDTFARSRDEMIWLLPGETRAYDTQFTVLTDHSGIARACDHIAAIARQPDADFPQPSGHFPPLWQSRGGAD